MEHLEDLKVSEDAKRYIIENEIDLNYGARQLKRKVQELIEDKIANSLVIGELNEEDIIEFYVEENEIRYKVIKKIDI